MSFKDLFIYLIIHLLPIVSPKTQGRICYILPWAIIKMVYYRDNKGRFTTLETFIERLKSGEIEYNDKRTNDQRSVTKFRQDYNIDVNIYNDKYYIEKIKLDSGKRIYLAYRNDRERNRIIQDIINHQESPKPRKDGQRITDDDRKELKKYEFFKAKKISPEDYKNLSYYFDKELDKKILK